MVSTEEEVTYRIYYMRGLIWQMISIELSKDLPSRPTASAVDHWIGTEYSMFPDLEAPSLIGHYPYKVYDESLFLMFSLRWL